MPLMHRVLVVASLLALPLAAGPLCVTDTLASYIALGSSGCSLGVYTLKDFAFGPNTAGGGATLALNSSITVTPMTIGGVNALGFSSPVWSAGVTSSQFTTYQIAYFWDPGPIRSLADVLFAQSPVFPGKVQINSTACLGSNFPCGINPTASVQVSDDGVTLALRDIQYFSTVSLMGVIDTIDLHANGASADFQSYGSFINIPEPALALPICFALAVFWRWRRL